MVDALGLPVAFEVTVGNRHDSPCAACLIATVEPKCLLGDEAYDADAIREDLHARDAVAVIHPKRIARRLLLSTRTYTRPGRRWSAPSTWLKQARRFATRYEKTLRNYVAVAALGCALLWLRI